MAANEHPDPQLYQRTRDTLGKVIKKPPLNDKLLSRPPFKYLRDIILEVNKATDIFKGLYSGKELDTKAEWDRDLKTTFLQKAIDVVVFTTGKNIKARPSKIIAGVEVDRTNEFLQLLGLAILKKLNSTEAVQKVLKGEKPSQQTDKKKDGKQIKPEVKKVNDTDKNNEDIKQSPQQVEEKENSNEAIAQPSVERPQNRPSSRRVTREALKRPKVEDEIHEAKQKDESDEHLVESQVKPLERPISAIGGRKGFAENKVIEEVSNDNVQSPLSASSTTTTNELINSAFTRPSSARPPAPRVVTRVTDTEESQTRMASGNERVPPNVILDKEDEDDDDFVVTSSNLPLSSGEVINNNPQTTNSKPEGALAKTLLETKERFVGEEGMNRSDGQPRDIMIDEVQKRREREIVEKEVKTLQHSIQNLCQSANPLGKMMDYVQEDLDSMQQELKLWKKENASHAEALRKEEIISEEELTPLQSHLTELEERVIEQFDMISTMKLTVMRNEEQIKNLIMTQ